MWLIDRGLYRCSHCKQLWSEWWVSAKPIERMKKECPYCPMCGKYNGGAENEENGYNNSRKVENKPVKETK